MSEGKALTGGFTNYYLVKVEHPQREEQLPYQAECEDIIRALKMSFDEACEFKAIWRTAAARLGNGKPGQKALYDCEKRVHYAQASLRQEQIAQGLQPKPTPKRMVWYAHIGQQMPAGLDPSDMVSVELRSGDVLEAKQARGWEWKDDGTAAAIVKFCLVRKA
ncbi:hypothetical protein HYP85_gp063 [Pseudomonas phage Zuri]|uniref:Uncharacterized protein n=1 Tax=Pseudomonas phage Zuri TaxID=2604899 RepID=A0A5C1K5C7_9CAUD|nr:hypothetical protein HYP85_gp063 [Pseudomonas phage Zuri]QEM41160.1 hypothetical protein Zuri_63 [Pseudomonas phage Zuri]